LFPCSNEEFWVSGVKPGLFDLPNYKQYGNVPDEFFPLLPDWDAPDGLANPKGSICAV
jgi:hypothetical protein